MTTAPASSSLAGSGESVSAVLDVSGMLTAMPVPPVGEMAALVEQVRRVQRVTAMLAATQATLLARVLSRVTRADPSVMRSSSSAEVAVRSVAAELGAALNLSDVQVQRQLSDAFTLVTRFPATHAALDDGRITAAHVRVIVQAGAGISDDDARGSYENVAVEQAARTTPWRLKSALAALAEQAMPVTLDERHREARKARCITVTDAGDGMSTLSVFMPTLLAHGARDRILSMARAIKHEPDDPRDGYPHSSTPGPGGYSRPGTSTAGGRPGEPGETRSTGGSESRTVPQIAVDVLCDLLLGADPTTTAPAIAAIRGRVQVTVPVTTLAGLTDTGAVLTGIGPIDAGTVRTLAAHQTGWDRIITDTATGAVLAVDRYTPSTAMRRFLAARDEHCRFPGCQRPTHTCDIDHTIAWEHGGTTRVDNLAHLCRRHHTLKHNSAWKVENLGSGTLRWTSPLGHQYTDTPPRRPVTFTPTSQHTRTPTTGHLEPMISPAVATPQGALTPPDPPPF